MYGGFQPSTGSPWGAGRSAEEGCEAASLGAKEAPVRHTLIPLGVEPADLIPVSIIATSPKPFQLFTEGSPMAQNQSFALRPQDR